MISLIVYGGNNIILQPILEAGLTPSKVYQSHLISPTFESSDEVIYGALVVSLTWLGSEMILIVCFTGTT